ncbi:hypothetical protein [Saccharothrix longispora]|uniref:hypothetical protein n=1 Tax=Saccharothrix longispora TaxID=33920 RepID=UPI0028FD1226|nr:hypothetical protein [Saccharothrix longispora]MBY8848915.1 hypothetical protein [Saccharothrix sp. MB29]MDU0289409.1 hypothetical protein [Saccharothrix longispora]
MFEEDRQTSPKKRFSSVALLAAGGAVVATVIATLASMMATGDPAPAQPEPRAGVDASFTTSESVLPDGRTATVVVTVSTRAGAAKRPEAPAAKPEEQGSATESARVTTVTPTEPRATTTQPPSTPPSSAPASSSASSSATTTPTTATTETGAS